MTNSNSDAALPPPRRLPDPIHGKADWREYRALGLANGVTVVLVHDRESKTTAAGAAVTAGAGSDPRSLPGLAHFCEHMLFMGSEKYPGENEFKKYLSQHGGRSNAATSLHWTYYKVRAIQVDTYIHSQITLFVSHVVCVFLLGSLKSLPNMPKPPWTFGPISLSVLYLPNPPLVGK